MSLRTPRLGRNRPTCRRGAAAVDGCRAPGERRRPAGPGSDRPARGDTGAFELGAQERGRHDLAAGGVRHVGRRAGSACGELRRARVLEDGGDGRRGGERPGGRTSELAAGGVGHASSHRDGVARARRQVRVRIECRRAPATERVAVTSVVAPWARSANIVPVKLAADIGSLNVTVIFEPVATSAAPGAGYDPATVGQWCRESAW